MKSRFKNLLMLSAVAALLSGCVSHVFNEPMAVSTKSAVYPHVRAAAGDVQTDWSNGCFVIIPFVTDPRKCWDRVLDQAAARNCNAVTDIQLRHTGNSFFWVFPPIVWVNVEAQGTAVQIP